MSVFTPTKTAKDIKVRNSQYIKTENKPDEADTKPAEPVNPEQPEAN